MAPRLRWRSDEDLSVGESRFRLLPEGLTGAEKLEITVPEFLVVKPRWMIERYAALVGELRPRRIVELGVFQGGSTALLAELARPEVLVAVDAQPLRFLTKAIVDKTHMAEAVRVHGQVDQGDRAALRGILDKELGDAPLDLVVDDCSHLYELTLASFNEIFPRLRPGGMYVIEDWSWAHAPLGAGPAEAPYPEKTPLTRLIFEAILAMPSTPGLVDEIRVDAGAVELRRGDAAVDPATFDLAAASAPRGQAMLSPR